MTTTAKIIKPIKAEPAVVKKGLNAGFPVKVIKPVAVSASFKKADSSAKGKYYVGLGRRKRAIAQVYMHIEPQDKLNTIQVNQKLISDYFDTEKQQTIAVKPLLLTKLGEQFFVTVKVNGGGKDGQAGAVCMGIARALVAYDSTLKKQLKDAGFLTRDPREKERKKYGLKRARKAHQYTKR